jgi:hypothetical protein
MTVLASTVITARDIVTQMNGDQLVALLGLMYGDDLDPAEANESHVKACTLGTLRLIDALIDTTSSPASDQLLASIDDQLYYMLHAVHVWTKIEKLVSDTGLFDTPDLHTVEDMVKHSDCHLDTFLDANQLSEEMFYGPVVQTTMPDENGDVAVFRHGTTLLPTLTMAYNPAMFLSALGSMAYESNMWIQHLSGQVLAMSDLSENTKNMMRRCIKVPELSMSSIIEEIEQADAAEADGALSSYDQKCAARSKMMRK